MVRAECTPCVSLADTDGGITIKGFVGRFGAFMFFGILPEALCKRLTLKHKGSSYDKIYKEVQVELGVARQRLVEVRLHPKLLFALNSLAEQEPTRYTNGTTYPRGFLEDVSVTNKQMLEAPSAAGSIASKSGIRP